MANNNGQLFFSILPFAHKVVSAGNKVHFPVIGQIQHILIGIPYLLPPLCQNGERFVVQAVLPDEIKIEKNHARVEILLVLDGGR